MIKVNGSVKIFSHIFSSYVVIAGKPSYGSILTGTHKCGCGGIVMQANFKFLQPFLADDSCTFVGNLSLISPIYFLVQG